MGASKSKPASTGGGFDDCVFGVCLGLRIHRVYPRGPGEAAGLEVFFDYILEADHHAYSDDSDETLASFTSFVAQQENREITLNVFNARKKSLRLIKIVPRKWDGIGLLGLSVKFAEFTALDEGARVVNVYEGSPAHAAGLVPFTDYLLATNLQLFVDMDCARVHIAEHVGEQVQVYVYNSITESVRKTVIVPRYNWGGKGTLGCDLANGYIHRIPLVKDIWSYPNKAVASDAKDEQVETINLGAATSSGFRGAALDDDSKALPEPYLVPAVPAEPYLPPSIVDLRLATIVLEDGQSSHQPQVEVESDDDADHQDAQAPSAAIPGHDGENDAADDAHHQAQAPSAAAAAAVTPPSPSLNNDKCAGDV